MGKRGRKGERWEQGNFSGRTKTGAKGGAKVIKCPYRSLVRRGGRGNKK